MATETEAEAEQMRRAPGIIFVDGPAGRRARVAGTGLEVFEIIKYYIGFERDWQELRQRFDWLTDEQLRAAVRYYELYPAEIDARLEEEASWTPERVYAMYPFTKPRKP